MTFDKKRRTAEFFDQLAAPGYGQHVPLFLAMGQRLVEFADITQGMQTLDAAAGRGASLFPTAKLVGKSGRVTGIDIAEAMIRETIAEINQRGLDNADMLLMDAENLDFPSESYERVLCGFALFFFPDLHRALTEFKRVLKPGGRLVLSSFKYNSYPWDWYEDLLKSFKISSRDGEIDKLVTHHMGTSEEIVKVVEEAGFSHPETIYEDFVYFFEDENAWWEQIWTSLDRPILEKLHPERIEEFKKEAFERLLQFKKVDGIQLRDRVIFARATKDH